MKLVRPPPGVLAEDGRLTAGSPSKAEKDANRRGLTCTIRAEEAVYFTCGYGQVETVERANTTVGLHEVARLNHSGH